LAVLQFTHGPSFGKKCPHKGQCRAKAVPVATGPPVANAAPAFVFSLHDPQLIVHLSKIAMGLYSSRSVTLPASPPLARGRRGFCVDGAASRGFCAWITNVFQRVVFYGFPA
jgi:hypothetical protein